MMPLTYDQAEFVLILISPAIGFLFFAPVFFYQWTRWDMPAGVSLIYDSLWLGVVAPFVAFMDWSINYRPSPSAHFAELYFSLWADLMKSLQ